MQIAPSDGTTISNASPLMEVYGRKFFDDMEPGSLRSARVLVPIVMEMLHPKSVVDVGCGVGTWLRAFLENGVTEILGIDGDYVPRNNLQVDLAHFKPMELSAPVAIDRTFSLAVSLEVAEHLPTQTSARFVEFLTTLAPAVLFSAAIPGQSGTNHINEQWPWFWEKLFADRGYKRLDVLRPRIWNSPDVEWWYKQNSVLYLRADRIGEYEFLKAEVPELQGSEEHAWQLVEQSVLQGAIENPGIRTSFRRLLRALVSGVRRRIGLR